MSDRSKFCPDPILDTENPCAWCEGTGNELCRMYRKCPYCGGTGTAPGDRADIAAREAEKAMTRKSIATREDR